MKLALKDAGDRLAELAARADAGEEVVLTRDGAPPLRLVAADVTRPSKPTPEEREALFRELDERLKARPKRQDDSSNHDFLYDEHGLPC